MNNNAIVVLIACLILSTNAFARDDHNKYSIADAMAAATAQGNLDSGYQFKFGKQGHGVIAVSYGEYMSNKKTNAFNKTDQEACNWAFLSAMLSFQDRITKLGGNAVVNIRSYYKKNEFSSETEFECGNGAIIAGVTFKGDVVKLN